MTHICGICFQDSAEHDSRCYEQGCEGDTHWPALCCPGCPCRSYEEAHARPNSDDDRQARSIYGLGVPAGGFRRAREAAEKLPTVGQWPGDEPQSAKQRNDNPEEPS